MFTNQIQQQPKPRVLVVDDHPDAADTLASLLFIIFPCTVNVAMSGVEALDMAVVLRPQIVFLDLSMPSMSGCETARRMRQQPWGPDATIIALSAWGDSDTRRETQRAGMDFHLVKPVSVEGLLDVLTSLGR